MYSPRRVIGASALALAMGVLSTLPASASTASNKATFCGDVSSLSAVPVLTLPTSIDFFSIISSLNTLTSDQNTLRRDVITLNALSALAPSATLKGWYAAASASAANEITGLQTVLSNATTLLNGNKSNRAILSVASAASGAAADAAVTNTYLSVAAPVAEAACAHWPGTTPPKPVVKPKPKPRPSTKPKKK